MELKPRLLRPVEVPLGNYLRPGRNDHVVLSQLLAEERLDFTGLVVNPCLVDRHSNLLDEARRQGLETVLDQLSLELSTEGGITRSGVAAPPWAGTGVLTPPDFLPDWLSEHVSAIARFAVEGEFSSVLAPAPLLDTLDDDWLAVDARIVEKLRTP